MRICEEYIVPPMTKNVLGGIFVMRNTYKNN